MTILKSYKELDVFKRAMDAAMRVFQLTQSFPSQERFSLVDQFRRSSRSVCANIAESWRKRRYRAAFISKLSDAEMEASETQVWIEFGVRCGYLVESDAKELESQYDCIMAQLVKMIEGADKWMIREDHSRV